MLSFIRLFGQQFTVSILWCATLLVSFYGLGIGVHRLCRVNAVATQAYTSCGECRLQWRGEVFSPSFASSLALPMSLPP